MSTGRLGLAALCSRPAPPRPEWTRASPFPLVVNYHPGQWSPNSPGRCWGGPPAACDQRGVSAEQCWGEASLLSLGRRRACSRPGPSTLAPKTRCPHWWSGPGLVWRRSPRAETVPGPCTSSKDLAVRGPGLARAPSGGSPALWDAGRHTGCSALSCPAFPL